VVQAYNRSIGVLTDLKDGTDKLTSWLMRIAELCLALLHG